MKDTRGLLMFSYQFLCMTVITKSLNVYANLLKWFYSYSLYQKKITSPSLALVVQFSSVAQSCPTLCNPMNRSMPGLPVYHQLPEFTQTHIHQVRDAIQPSHPLSFPSPPAPNPSQHQSLFQWVVAINKYANVILQ